VTYVYLCESAPDLSCCLWKDAKIYYTVSKSAQSRAGLVLLYARSCLDAFQLLYVCAYQASNFRIPKSNSSMPCTLHARLTHLLVIKLLFLAFLVVWQEALEKAKAEKLEAIAVAAVQAKEVQPAYLARSQLKQGVMNMFLRT